MPLEGVGGVALHDLHQTPLGPAGRDRDPDRLAPAGGQPCLEELRARGQRLHQHPRRHLLALHVQLLEERGDQTGPIEVLDPVDDPAAPTEHPAATDVEDLDRGLEVVLDERHHVEILGRREHHLLGLERSPCREELVAEARRLLELLALGSGAHLGLQPAEHGPRVPGEELAHRLDVGSVRLVGDARRFGHAGAGAASDVVVQARPLGARALVEERVRARPDGEHPGQRVEGVADRPGVAVRAEVAHALALRAPEHLRAWPLLPHGQGEVRVRLVVAVADVEPRLVLLDQVVLEHQRVDLGRSHDPLDATARSRPSPRFARAAASPSRRRGACGATRPCRRRSPGRPRRGTGRRPERRGSRRLEGEGRSRPRC